MSHLRQTSMERQEAARTLMMIQQAHVYHKPRQNDRIAVLYNNGIFYNGKITKVNKKARFPYRVLWDAVDEDSKQEFAALPLRKEDFPEKWYFI